jgi:hypothetical protein
VILGIGTQSYAIGGVWIRLSPTYKRLDKSVMESVFGAKTHSSRDKELKREAMESSWDRTTDMV